MEYLLSGDLEQDIYHLVARAFMRLDLGDQVLMGKFGLTLKQSWALVHLGDEEGRSLTELAELLICDKSNVTSVVDKLESEELLVRKRGKEGDRRYTRVVLTEKGRRLRDAVIAAREQMVRERLQGLGEDALRQLHDLLERLNSTLATQYRCNEEERIIERAFELVQAQPLTSKL